MRRSQALQERRRLELITIAGDRAVERNRLVRLEVDLERSQRRRQMCRRRLEHDTCASPLAVETEIDEIRRVALDNGPHRAAPSTMVSPYLEYVGEIIVECDRQQETDAICTEISHGKAVK
jgi:hypothetical protein